MHYTFDDQFDPTPWTDAWTRAVDAQWPTKKPDDVLGMMSVVRNLGFVAPEVLPAKVALVWAVYEAHGNTDVGRAAVALATVMSATVKRVAG